MLRLLKSWGKMDKSLDIRGKLKRIENPIIFDEIQMALSQGLKSIEIVKLLLLELTHKRELVEILKSDSRSLPTNPPELNGQIDEPDMSDIFASLD